MSLNNLWIEKYRPAVLADIILDDDDRDFFESFIDKQEIPNLLFAGTPGTGKTTSAKVIINDILQCQYLYINASDENGIDAIRSKVINFAKTKSVDGKIKCILLDEVDSITNEAQKALRNTMEEYAANTRFILTCNYLYKLIPALQSRCQLINLVPPTNGVVRRVVEILKAEKIKVPEEQKPLLVEFISKYIPDVRRIINSIQKFSFSGELNINTKADSSLAKEIWEAVKTTRDPKALRKTVIESEIKFDGDYNFLLRSLFDEVCNDDKVQAQQKTDILLCVAEAMKNDAFVVDKEINMFACLLQLTQMVGK